VEVYFRGDADVSYSCRDDRISLIRRHYLPLTDPIFLDIYDRFGLYRSSLRFVINGQVLEPKSVKELFALEKVKDFFPKKKKRRMGYGVLGIAAEEYPVDSSLCGMLICTHGKVIKGELFNQFPGSMGPRIFGLVEVPKLVEFLTTSKADFNRRGKVREFEELYSPLRQEFQRWLREIGVQTLEMSKSDDARRLEKELKSRQTDVLI